MRTIVLSLTLACLALAAPADAKPRSGHGSSSHASTSHRSSKSYTTHPRSTNAKGVPRNSKGRIARDPKQKAQFEKTHPCPSTGKSHGACPGYVVDHIRPLKRGGADRPENMQWQTKEAARQKDKTESRVALPPESFLWHVVSITGRLHQPQVISHSWMFDHCSPERHNGISPIDCYHIAFQ